MPNSGPSRRIPKYRLHRPSGQAVARFNGIDYYLGKHGSPESRDEYDRLLGEWMINGRQAPLKVVSRPIGQMTINELILGYLQFADGYYSKNGQPTGEIRFDPTFAQTAAASLWCWWGHGVCAAGTQERPRGDG